MGHTLDVRIDKAPAAGRVNVDKVQRLAVSVPGMPEALIEWPTSICTGGCNSRASMNYFIQVEVRVQAS